MFVRRFASSASIKEMISCNLTLVACRFIKSTLPVGTWVICKEEELVAFWRWAFRSVNRTLGVCVSGDAQI